MKRLFIFALCATATAVSAECHMRTSIRVARQDIFGAPTDVQRIVTPDAQGDKCVLRYRLNIKGDWQTVEGEATAATEEVACTKALDVGQGWLLQDVAPKLVQADNQMVCSDAPEIQVHPVRIGDEIWESEVDVHSIPAERAYFQYKHTRCRFFVERDAKFQNLYIYQGVICRVNSTQHSKWRVIDRY